MRYMQVFQYFFPSYSWYNNSFIIDDNQTFIYR
uniref:Uncharacterized protein n=1 Tax=Lepeophtheirus salmonis TaxID=72036 RepID=A0A0K2VKM1_LEPSM